MNFQFKNTSTSKVTKAWNTLLNAMPSWIQPNRGFRDDQFLNLKVKNDCYIWRNLDEGALKYIYQYHKPPSFKRSKPKLKGRRKMIQRICKLWQKCRMKPFLLFEKVFMCLSLNLNLYNFDDIDGMKEKFKAYIFEYMCIMK